MGKKRPARASEPAPKIPEAAAADNMEDDRPANHVHVPTQTGLGISMFMLGIDAPAAWERDAIAELSRHEYYRNEYGALGIPLPSSRAEWGALIGKLGDPALLLAFEREEVTPSQLLHCFANRPKTDKASSGTKPDKPNVFPNAESDSYIVIGLERVQIEYDHAVYLKALIETGDWLSDPEFRKSHSVYSSDRQDRWRKKLPRAVAAHIETTSRGSRWVDAPMS